MKEWVQDYGKALTMTVLINATKIEKRFKLYQLYHKKYFSYLMWSVCSLLISLLGVFANLLVSQYDRLKYLETLWKKNNKHELLAAFR